MGKQDYSEIAKKVLEENGLYYYSTLADEPLECDSLTFISTVISIENELDITVSDKLLTNYPVTYNEWVGFIEQAVKFSEEEDDEEEDDEEEDDEEEDDDEENEIKN